METKRIEVECTQAELTQKKARLLAEKEAVEQKRLIKVAEIERQKKEEENQRNTNLQEEETKEQ